MSLWTVLRDWWRRQPPTEVPDESEERAQLWREHERLRRTLHEVRESRAVAEANIISRRLPDAAHRDD